MALVVKNPLANAGNIRETASIPGSGRSPGEGHGDPLQNSCLENPMDRGAWWATVHRVTKSWIRLKRLSTDAHRKFKSSVKGMTTHSSIFARITLWTEERGGLQSMGSQRVGHN